MLFAVLKKACYSHDCRCRDILWNSCNFNVSLILRDITSMNVNLYNIFLIGYSMTHFCSAAICQ